MLSNTELLTRQKSERESARIEAGKKLENVSFDQAGFDEKIGLAEQYIGRLYESELVKLQKSSGFYRLNSDAQSEEVQALRKKMAGVAKMHLDSARVILNAAHSELDKILEAAEPKDQGPKNTDELLAGIYQQNEHAQKVKRLAARFHLGGQSAVEKMIHEGTASQNQDPAHLRALADAALECAGRMPNGAQSSAILALGNRLHKQLDVDSGLEALKQAVEAKRRSTLHGSGQILSMTDNRISSFLGSVR